MRLTNRTATDDRPNRPPKEGLLSAASGEGRLRRVSIVLLVTVVLFSTTLPGSVAALAGADNVSGESPDSDDLVDGSELTNETDEAEAAGMQTESNDTVIESTTDASDIDDEQPADESKTDGDSNTSEAADTVENQSGDSTSAENATDDSTALTDEETNSTSDDRSNESPTDAVDEPMDDTVDAVSETTGNATADSANATGTDSTDEGNTTNTVDERVDNATDGATSTTTDAVQNGTASVDEHAENTTESADTLVTNASDDVEDEVQNTTDAVVDGVANITEFVDDSVANATNSVNESVTNATDVVSKSTSSATGSLNESVDATTDAVDAAGTNSTVLGATVSNTTAVVDDGVTTTTYVVNESVSTTTVLVDETVATSTGEIDTTVETVTDVVNETTRLTTDLTDEQTTVTAALVNETTGLVVESVETTTTVVDGTTSTVTYLIVDHVETTTEQVNETIRPTTDLVNGFAVTSTDLVNGTVVRTIDVVEGSSVTTAITDDGFANATLWVLVDDGALDASEFDTKPALSESTDFVLSARVTAAATTQFDETTDPIVDDPSLDLEGSIPRTGYRRMDRTVQSSVESTDDRLRTLVANERTVGLPEGELGTDESSADHVSEPAGPIETLRTVLPDVLSSFPDPSTSAATVGVVVGLGVVTRKFAQGSAMGPTVVPSMVQVLARRVRSLLAEWLDRLLAVLSIVGYSQYDDTDPLENERRRRLYEVVSEEPGIHVSRLAEETDIARSSVRYHLRILEAENVLAPAKIRGKRRFYPVDIDDPAIDAALADDASAAVVRTLVECEPATVSDLAHRLDLTPGTVTHHLQGLESDGVIERDRDGRAVKNRLVPAVRSRLSGRKRTDVPSSTTSRQVDAVGAESDDD